MMKWTNYHTHCHYCDGKGEPEDYIEEAIEQGMYVLGFSSHAPLSFDTDWTMPPGKLDEYLAHIRGLKDKSNDQLQILVGLEVDYIPGVISPTSKLIVDKKLDYCIGSVHYLGRFDDGKYWTVDETSDVLLKGIRQNFGGSPKKAIKAYYERIMEMVSQGGFDIIGHFDLIKKNNRDGRFFYEGTRWYKDLVFDALDCVKKSGVVLEINSGGISRGILDSFYPSSWILARCCELGIPVTINSDAHIPGNIIAEFSQAAQILKQVGYMEVCYLDSKGWHACEFDENGLKL